MLTSLFCSREILRIREFSAILRKFREIFQGFPPKSYFLVLFILLMFSYFRRKFPSSLAENIGSARLFGQEGEYFAAREIGLSQN